MSNLEIIEAMNTDNANLLKTCVQMHEIAKTLDGVDIDIDKIRICLDLLNLDIIRIGMNTNGLIDKFNGN